MQKLSLTPVDVEMAANSSESICCESACTLARREFPVDWLIAQVIKSEADSCKSTPFASSAHRSFKAGRRSSSARLRRAGIFVSLIKALAKT